MQKKILVAGATGMLGTKIIHALRSNGTDTRAIVRSSADQAKVAALKDAGVEIVEADFNSPDQLRTACLDISCVVSALSGLGDVIVDTQKRFMDAAIDAGVPRFIPSDYSLDFTNLVPGHNRNLDLRRTFHQYLDNKPIRATTIFNGAFMDLLAGQMPLILKKFHHILYWGNSNVKFDLTHTDDVAAYTAKVAVDNDSPRFLHIAGDTVNVKDVAALMTELTGEKYKLFRGGSIGRLNTLIKIGRFFSGNSHDLYPAWQGMQYMRDMMEGRAVLTLHDNNRYDDLHWLRVKEFLKKEVI